MTLQSSIVQIDSAAISVQQILCSEFGGQFAKWVPPLKGLGPEARFSLINQVHYLAAQRILLNSSFEDHGEVTVHINVTITKEDSTFRCPNNPQSGGVNGRIISIVDSPGCPLGGRYPKGVLKIPAIIVALGSPMSSLFISSSSIWEFKPYLVIILKN